MDEQQPKHVRRKRYKGTHPHSFDEKYKEKQPEKYAEEVTKVINQGRTPAGMHRSICVEEILNFVNPSPGQLGMDATLGYGGHSLEILKRIQPGGRLYAIDEDPIEFVRTSERLRSLGYGPETLVLKQMNFSEIDSIVAESGLLNFVIADLGVSSMQIDNPERGFTFKKEGPLDLRLNPTKGQPASAMLKTISIDRLQEILIDNSDEPYFEPIALAIVKSISEGEKIETTIQLREIITQALNFLPETSKEEIKKSCQRCFQALRIAVNDEYGSLNKLLDKLPDVLAPGGIAAILSFHSGEDRRVKKYFQYYFREGIYREIADGPIRPSVEERNSNPRARAAKLRWAIKA